MEWRNLSLSYVDRIKGLHVKKFSHQHNEGKMIRNIYLIGDKRTKRFSYFQKAADQLGIAFTFLQWSDYDKMWNQRTLEGGLVKIDPPLWQEADFLRVKEQLEHYRQILKELSVAGNQPAIYLNSPQAILHMLDKRKCKKILLDNGVSTTQVAAWQVENLEQLLEQMQKNHCFSVFLKPVYGSGAAGIMAFRYHPHTKKMMAYTTCHMENDRLYNTKKISCLTKISQIQPIIEQLCKLDLIAERWYPKAEYKGMKYDLRVLWQFHRMEYVVARQSKGPMTNLHLNNQALDYRRLELPHSCMEEIQDLCGQALEKFGECAMAGIDILLEKNSLKPYIIEINGQGDLIYQDIYVENKIYKNQLIWMKEQC